ncbi:TonB family protein [Mucilaginibacter yixingensis]|uniref:TonB family protein n=1 Tax=Mucilaginibacter yixingensis TaxID=1295612 RepID=A0A2T5JDR3_9SPHI|nr:energy transducer TonB [Mucilaginibacter yixingensis]PTQ99907.1 TonB family protein [Mucilaginibacter yixingensis]
MLASSVATALAQNTSINTSKLLPGQNAYYLDKDGERVDSKDSAQIVRVFNGYDSVAHLYDLSEYDIKSGQRIMIGRSSSGYPLSLEGSCVSFYVNGKRKSVISYKKGYPTGNGSFYYPNGKPYQILLYNDIKTLGKLYKSMDYIPESERQNIIASYDTTGKQMVIDGKGHFVGYSDDFKLIEQEGDVENGKRVGKWQGQLSNYTYTEQYNNGKLISGVSTDAEGLQHPYDKFRTNADYPTGLTDLYAFIGQTVRYPIADRKNNVQGKVFITFIISEDGTLHNLICLRAPSYDMADETIRVLKLSPKWKPSLVRGIPAKQVFTLPVSFTLSR